MEIKNLKDCKKGYVGKFRGRNVMGRNVVIIVYFYNKRIKLKRIKLF